MAALVDQRSAARRTNSGNSITGNRIRFCVQAHCGGSLPSHMAGAGTTRAGAWHQKNSAVLQSDHDGGQQPAPGAKRVGEQASDPGVSSRAQGLGVFGSDNPTHRRRYEQVERHRTSAIQAHQTTGLKVRAPLANQARIPEPEQVHARIPITGQNSAPIQSLAFFC